eukprot:87381-Prymnesium_polylepis.1
MAASAVRMPPVSSGACSASPVGVASGAVAAATPAKSVNCGGPPTAGEGCGAWRMVSGGEHDSST